MNSHIRGVCDGYAADGYLAIAPALFDRVRPRVDLGYTPDDIDRGRDLKAKATLEHALADVEAARASAASAGKVGIVGYCWGGYIAWMSGSRLPGFACAAPYYGGGMLEAAGEHPRCPVLAHFGETDAHIPVDGVRKFAAAHPESQVLIYPANHGFNCDQRGSFDAPSAKLARADDRIPAPSRRLTPANPRPRDRRAAPRSRRPPRGEARSRASGGRQLALKRTRMTFRSYSASVASVISVPSGA